MSDREIFFNEIDRILIEHQFEKTDTGYICVQQQQQQGATININGQIIQQQPSMVTNEFIITFLGEGWISKIDNSNKEYFEQLKFEITQNHNQVFCIEECYYYDDYNEIMKNFLNQ